MQPRLKAGIWVKAYMRRAELNGAAVYVVRRGDADAGTVLLKVNRLGVGCMVFTPTTGMDGNREWLRATGPGPVPEADADAYIARQLKYDPDIWVIEIEDRDGRHFLDEPVT
jgi:hypothetical protein